MNRSTRTFTALCIVFATIVALRTAPQPTLTIATDPVDVPVHQHDAAGGDTHYDHMVWAEGTVVTREDLWVVGFAASVDNAPEGVVHNLYVVEPETADTWCPENPKVLWAAGSVTMREEKTFPSPYGIYVAKGTRLSLIALIHNGTEFGGGKPYEDVSVRVRLFAEPVRTSHRASPISHHSITPGDCTIERPLFRIPAHAREVTFSSNRHPFTFHTDGHILSAGAHFHGAYAPSESSIALYLNGVRIDFFTMNDPFIGSNRNPKLLQAHPPLRVHAGDTLTLSATFDNPFEYAVEEGMAIVSFYFAPEIHTP